MKTFWLLFAALLLVFFTKEVLANNSDDIPFGIIEEETTEQVLELVYQAQEQLYDVAYAWGTLDLAHCSGFVSRYIALAGMPTALDDGGPASYVPELGSPIPSSNTLKQARRFELLDTEVEGEFVTEYSVDELLNNPTEWIDWGIRPGSLIYFAIAESHNGYNSYHHVAILLGYNEQDMPILADFAPGMAHGPIMGRDLDEVVDWLYYSIEDGGWNLSTANTINRPSYLSALVVDVLGISQAASDAGIWN